MGKKKSVVLMVLLTIVIVVLSAITLFPSFTLPGSGGVKKWNPVTLQYDLGNDLGGGYYAYYYPEGVISETEYTDNLPEAESDEYEEYVSEYVQHGGLYLKTDEDLGIVEKNADGKYVPTASFKADFEKAAKIVSDRFDQKTYSDYRVCVVDDFSIRVDIPAAEFDQNNTMVDRVSAAISSLANFEEVDVQSGGEQVKAIVNGAKPSDLIKGISIASRYNTSYLKITLTSAGKDMLNEVKDSLSAAPTDSSADTSSLTSLDILLGETKIVSVYSDNIMDNNEIRVMAVDNVYEDYLETMEILLNSAVFGETLENPISFTVSSVRTYEPVYGENVLDLLYIALGVIVLAILVLPIVKMGRFGIVSAYTSVSYLIVTAMCFAFINKGVFEITLGSALVFVAGLILVNILQTVIYGAVKAEFDLGKTVESAVKGGYRKTVGATADIYAVLLLAALAMLIGAAGLNTLAIQMIICVVTGAFCNLLWARAINYTFLSASKNKYKYFRFVREDDDDE